MIFAKVPWSEPAFLAGRWLRPIAAVKKLCWQEMLNHLRCGEWDLRLLPKPASGVAVTYPYRGQLFIYYLHGRGLFGRLTREDLLRAAEAEGLSGVKCDTENPATKRLLERIGFKVVFECDTGWSLELEDGH